MKVVIACDHRGYEGKRKVLPIVTRDGFEVIDLGCDSTQSVDYPDFAAPAGQMVADGQADCAILLDGSGIGMSIVANKIRGVRAALAHDEVTARIARENNHCNVLCIGTDLLGDDTLRKIVQIFLNTPFGEGRHSRRIAKIEQIEANGGMTCERAKALYAGKARSSA